MRINRLVPIVSTEKLEESKKFYMKNFGFQVLFANDWYVLLESSDKTVQIAFVMPNHKTQPPIFRLDLKGMVYFIQLR